MDDLLHALFGKLAGLGVKTAQGALHLAALGDDVGRQAAGELTHGQCNFLGRRNLAGDKLLERQVHMHARRDGVDADLGAGTMAALALERDAETVHARECWASVEHQAKRRLAVDVHGEGSLGTRVLKQAVGNGGASALKGLLARLEQQLDCGIGLYELRLARLEQTSRTKQRRRVHIVAASMHAAVGRSKGLARFFRNRQGVHIATEHDDRASLLVRARTVTLRRSSGTGADQAHDTRTVNEHAIGNSHLIQACLNIGRRLRKVVTEFGSLMEVMAPCSKLIGKCLGFFNQAIADSSLCRRGGLRRWLRLEIGQSWCHRCPPVTFLQ